MKNRKATVAQHGVDAKSSPLSASRLTPAEQRFALARELFTKAAQEACSHDDRAPFLLCALHELEQLAGAPAPALTGGAADMEGCDRLLQQIARHEPGTASEARVAAHRLALLLTDVSVSDVHPDSLATIAAVAERAHGGSAGAGPIAGMFEALANVRQGPGGQDHFAGLWACDYFGAYRPRVDVAEVLAERMAQLADELRDDARVTAPACAAH